MKPLEYLANWLVALIIALLFLLLLAPVLYGADITPGYTYSAADTTLSQSTLNTALAGNLNSTAISSKPANTAPVATDLLLLLSGTTLQKVRVDDLTDYLTNAAALTNPANTDSVLLFSGSSLDVKKVALGNLVVGVPEFHDLIISNNSANVVGVSCSYAVLTNVNGVFRGAPGQLSINIANTGTNGLDTGSEAASTWYYVWLVGDGTNTIRGLLSTNSTGPTMPAGFTFKGRAGAIFNTAASAFTNFTQVGKWAWFDQYGVVTNLSSDGTPNTLAAGSLDSFRRLVAPIAIGFSGSAGRTDSGGGSIPSVSNMRICPSPNTTYPAWGSAIFSSPSNSVGVVYSSFRSPLFEFGSSRQFYFFTQGGQADTWSIFVNGFEIP